MARPKLLDLFCGAGGAAMGYHRAGFDVVGVDIKPQPRYPFEFHQADALTFPLEGFDAIHASPPCLLWTRAGFRWKHRVVGPDCLTPTRTRLRASGRPYVIENVPGAPVEAQVRLCGTHFDRPYIKHRYFECSVPLSLPPMTCSHGRGGLLAAGLVDVFDADMVARIPWREAAALLEVGWVGTRQEMRNAIPPAYTEWIGRQLLAHLGQEAPMPRKITPPKHRGRDQVGKAPKVARSPEAEPEPARCCQVCGLMRRDVGCQVYPPEPARYTCHPCLEAAGQVALW